MNVMSLYLCSYVVPSMYVVVVLGSLQKIQYLPLLVTGRPQLVHELCQKNLALIKITLILPLLFQALALRNTKSKTMHIEMTLHSQCWQWVEMAEIIQKSYVKGQNHLKINSKNKSLLIISQYQICLLLTYEFDLLNDLKLTQQQTFQQCGVVSI